MCFFVFQQHITKKKLFQMGACGFQSPSTIIFCSVCQFNVICLQKKKKEQDKIRKAKKSKLVMRQQKNDMQPLKYYKNITVFDKKKKKK